MFVIFGRRNSRHRHVGYASDFCEACKSPAIIAKFKWFSWGHIFWIPIFPFGYKYAWICGACGEDAAGKPKTGAAAKVFLALFFGFIAYGFYYAGTEEGFSGTILLWLVLFVAVTLGFIAWIFFPGSRPSKEMRSAVIPPVDTNHCVYCGGDLAKEPNVRCVSCELDVFDGRRGKKMK